MSNTSSSHHSTPQDHQHEQSSSCPAAFNYSLAEAEAWGLVRSDQHGTMQAGLLTGLRVWLQIATTPSQSALLGRLTGCPQPWSHCWLLFSVLYLNHTGHLHTCGFLEAPGCLLEEGAT